MIKFKMWKKKNEDYTKSTCTSSIHDKTPVKFQKVLFVCIVVLQPCHPFWSCRVWSVYLTTLLLGGLSPLNGTQCSAHSFARN